jgi:hypothetical protein
MTPKRPVVPPGIVSQKAPAQVPFWDSELKELWMAPFGSRSPNRKGIGLAKK